MIVEHSKELAGIEVSGEGISQVVKKVLVGPDEGWTGWVMRLFELGPGGHTPRHTHDWPHINWVVEGEGILHVDGTDYPIKAGSYGYVPNNIPHQFKSNPDSKLAFICIVPEEGEV